MKSLPLIFILLAILSSCAASSKNGAPAGAEDEMAASSGEEKISTYRIVFEDVPEIGKSPTGQKIYLGGFSGLRYLGKTKTGKLRFVTNTDMGPGLPGFAEGGITKRPLVLPNFQPRIVFFEVDLQQKTATITRQIYLTQPSGKPLSSKLPRSEGDRSVDIFGKTLPFDVYGMDLEAIDVMEDGTFWMAEQYGPSIAHFSKSGSLMTLLKPGTGLPKILEYRRENRGFESLAVIGKRLYATMQSPVSKSENLEDEKPSKILRVIEVDLLGSRTLGQYVYLLNPDDGSKIGDMTSVGPRRLLFMEKGHDARDKRTKKVYLVSLSDATNLQLLSEKIAGLGGNLEQMSEKDLAAENIKPVKKKMILDLEAAGAKERKIEGMDLVDNEYLALISDNDFMLTGKWDKKTGAVDLSQEKSVLYLFRLEEDSLEFNP